MFSFFYKPSVSPKVQMIIDCLLLQPERWRAHTALGGDDLLSTDEPRIRLQICSDLSIVEVKEYGQFRIKGHEHRALRNAVSQWRDKVYPTLLREALKTLGETE